jgi:hypothetical protein
VMNIGEPTKEVIEILQSTRLYLDATEVAKDVDRLRALVRGHEYPKRKADWWSTRTGKDRNTPEYKKDWKTFLAHFIELRDEYNALRGRLRQVEAVARQIDEHSDKIDEHSHLEIRAAYYKTRNRRFQPRHLWPTEVSSKEDTEPTVLPDENVLFGDAENDEVEFPTEALAISMEKIFTDAGAKVERIDRWLITNRRRPDQFTATTSSRGRWFRVRAQFDTDRWWVTDQRAADGTPITWQDDYTGKRRR